MAGELNGVGSIAHSELASGPSPLTPLPSGEGNINAYVELASGPRDRIGLPRRSLPLPRGEGTRARGSRQLGVRSSGGWAVALALSLLFACDSNTRSVEEPADGWDLGPDAFVPDAAEDLGGDGGDAADQSDVDDASGDEPIVGQPCSLLDPAACDGLKCTPDVWGQGVCRPIARDPAAEGEACGAGGVDDCDAGLICADPDGLTLRCLRPCDAEALDACGESQSCTDPLPGLAESVGVCVVG